MLSTKQKKRRISVFLAIFGILILVVISGIYLHFYEPAKQSLNGLNVPVGSLILRPAKVKFSDVYWWKVLGEKIIESPLSYEETLEYIEEHNTKEQLEYIRIFPVNAMLDDFVYWEDNIYTETGESAVRIFYWKEL